MGWGANSWETSWVKQLAPHFVVENLAISGSFCKGQVTYALPYITKYAKPGDKVFWLTGYNDLQNNNLAEYREYIAKGIQELAHFFPIIVGTPTAPGFDERPYRQASGGYIPPEISRLPDGHPDQYGHDTLYAFAKALLSPYRAYLPEIAL